LILDADTYVENFSIRK